MSSSKYRLILSACLILSLNSACSKDDDDGGKPPSKMADVQTCEKGVASKSIYGPDDRRDWFEVTDATLLGWARSTVALIPKKDVSSSTTAGWADIKADTYASARGLCANQPYREQPTGAFCSGFFVGSDLIVTAGHCLTSEAECKQTVFVFDYAVRQSSVYPTQVPEANIYGCQRVISRSSGAQDYAVIQVDRAVTNRTPFQIRRQGAPALGTAVTMIGHPAGLPSKIADGGTVSAVGDRIVADVDAFGGNSGSAVIDRATGTVDGILVAGNADYDWQSGCFIEHRCGTDCDGEKIYPMQKIAHLIPVVASELTTEQPETPVPTCSTGKLASESR